HLLKHLHKKVFGLRMYRNRRLGSTMSRSASSPPESAEQTFISMIGTPGLNRQFLSRWLSAMSLSERSSRSVPTLAIFMLVIESAGKGMSSVAAAATVLLAGAIFALIHSG